MARSLGFHAWVAPEFGSGVTSSTSISSTSTGGSFGEPGHVGQKCAFWWRRRSAPHTFWYCFAMRTLLRGPSLDCFWHSLDGPPFEIHPCPLDLFTQRKRAAGRAPQRRKGSATQKDSTANSTTEQQGSHT